MARNYIKAVLPDRSSHQFFFEDTILESVQDAYALANELPNASLSIYRPAPVAGAWDRIAIVGHRHYEAIKADMHRTTDADKLFRLKEELDAVVDVWRDVRPEEMIGAAA